MGKNIDNKDTDLKKNKKKRKDKEKKTNKDGTAGSIQEKHGNERGEI
jgi:hypothetical protein